jgi:hypothetical protein
MYDQELIARALVFDVVVSERDGSVKEATYMPDEKNCWQAKRVFHALECEDATCEDDCEGCGDCLRFIEMGLKVIHNGERHYFIAARTGLISAKYWDKQDIVATTITSLGRMVSENSVQVIDWMAELFCYPLATGKQSAPVQERPKTPGESRSFAKTQYIAPLTQQVHRAKVNKIRQQKCISEAHAVAQYKILANKGIDAAIACCGGTYVVKWEDAK